MFNTTNSNAIISKSKNIFSIFFCISEIYIKFGIFWKEIWASEVICFWNYRLQKAGLFKWQKSPISEHLWTVNILKTTERFLKSARQYFSHIFWSLWRETSSKNSFLVVSKILRLFVIILTPNDKYSLSLKASVWWKQFKCYYLQINKRFLNFLLHFQYLHIIWNPVKKNMRIWSYFFLKL